MTQVKICGVCDVAAAESAASAGADLIGLHFCSSRRRITPEQGQEIARALGRRRPRLVGGFIDQPESEVEQVAGEKFNLLGVRSRSPGCECVGDEVLDQESADGNNPRQGMQAAQKK